MEEPFHPLCTVRLLRRPLPAVSQSWPRMAIEWRMAINAVTALMAVVRTIITSHFVTCN